MTVGLEIGGIAVAITIMSSFANKKLVDQKKVKKIQTTIKDFQKELNEAKKKDDTEAVKKLEKQQKEISPLIGDMMKLQFKPMIYTFLPIILIFQYLRMTYNGTGTIITLPVIGGVGWFGWYFISAMGTGILIEILYKRFTKHLDEGENHDKTNAQK